MNHPAARGFDPAVAATHVTVRVASLARETIERDLRRRLGERKIIDPETNLPVAPEYLPRERVEDTLEIGHGELLVDRQALVLEEDRLADRVRRFVPVAAPGDDHADRRLALLHDPHLHRRGVRTAKDGARRIVAERIRDPKRVPFLASGVARRDVERFEVVVIPLDLGALDRLETHGREDTRNLARGLRDRMQPPDAYAPRREGQVFTLRTKVALERFRAQRGAPFIECLFDATLGLVHRGSVRGLIGCRELRDPLGCLGEQTFLAAEVLHAGGLERGLARGGRDLGHRAVRELLQVFARHCASSFRQHKARRSFGTKAGLRGTTRVPFSLTRRTLGRSAIGLHPDRLFCRSAPERILASSARPALTYTGLSFTPRVAVLLSFGAAMTCWSACSTFL